MPPPEYRIWWDEVERCAGLRADYFEIEWRVGAPVDADGYELTGAWTPPRYITLRSFYLTSEPAVKHEMLHHLTRGELPHSSALFQTCTRPIGRRAVITLGG